MKFISDIEEIGKAHEGYFTNHGQPKEIFWEVYRDFTQAGKELNAKALIDVFSDDWGDKKNRFHVVGNGVYTRMPANDEFIDLLEAFFNGDDERFNNIPINELIGFYSLCNLGDVINKMGICVSNSDGSIITDEAVPIPFNALVYNRQKQEYTAAKRGAWYFNNGVFASEAFRHGALYLTIPGLSGVMPPECFDLNTLSFLELGDRISPIPEYYGQEIVRQKLGWLGVPVFENGNGSNAVLEYTEDARAEQFTSVRLVNMPRNTKCAGIELLAYPDNESGVCNLYKGMIDKPQYLLPIRHKGDLVGRV